MLRTLYIPGFHAKVDLDASILDGGLLITASNSNSISNDTSATVDNPPDDLSDQK